MGRRIQLAKCEICPKDEVADELGKADGDEFWIQMEHLDREELLEHLENVECPRCHAIAWTLTDLSCMQSPEHDTGKIVTMKDTGVR